MKREQAEEIIQRFAETAAKVLEEHGVVRPIAAFYGKKGGTMLELDDMFAGPDRQRHQRKDAGMGAIQHIMKVEEAEWYILVVEAWTAEMTPEKGVTWDELRKRVPSDLENYEGRREVIWFQFEDHDIGAITARRFITRDEGGKPHAGPLEILGTTGQAEGRMVGLLPPRGKPQ